MLLLAIESLPPADPSWGAQLWAWGNPITTLVALVMGVYIAGRRKPSVDVDLENLARRVQALEEDMKGIDRKLDAGTQLHMQFGEKQAANAAALKGLVGSVHELNQRVTTMPDQIANLLRNFKPR